MTITPTADDTLPGTATPRPRAGRWLVTAGTAAIVLAADQITKSLVLALDPASSGRTPTGLLAVHLVRNPGAGFGIGSGHPLAITLVALALTIGVGTAARRSRSRAAELCWAVVLGGAAGNLADRIFRSPGLGRGAVVDWVHVAGYPATFNLADLAIRLGVIAAVAVMIARRPRSARETSSGATTLAK
jgi:signal peptidase II